MTRLPAALLMALPLLARPSAAGEAVDVHRPAARGGLVSIENAAGSIHVVGWDRAEVAVTGAVGRGAAVNVTGGPNRTRIEVEAEGNHNPQSVSSDLEVRVPVTSRVEIEGFSASITVADVSGAVRAESVNGSIAVSGSMTDVRAETVNGSVEVSAPAVHVSAESVNGSVTVRGASGDLEATSVNGRVSVTGGTFTRARLESVNGSVRFEGKLSDGGWLEAETVGGSVDLVLPASVGADFTLSTFSGEIQNELGPAARRASRYTTEKELHFTIGNGKARINVHTLSGRISVRKQ
ncbi:MAG TPA: DUF4097 family beta strand repeat-containing protein [Vicinamibacteria bacterium]